MEIRQKTENKPREVRCPRCLAKDIVPSKPRGIIDDFMIFGIGRIPRHCRSCGKRFYVNQSRVGGAVESGDPIAKKKAGA